MKVRDNAQNEQKKGDMSSKQKLILGIAALLVIIGVGVYSRLPISTGQPFKIAMGTVVLDARTSHGQDLFDNGFEVKEFKPMDKGHVLQPDDKIGTKSTFVSCNVSLDGVPMGNVYLNRTSKYGSAAKKCKVGKITVYVKDENKDKVTVEGIEQAPVMVSDLTMERLSAALGDYTDSSESLAGDGIMDYTWKRKHYYLTVSYNTDNTLFAVETEFRN